MDHKQILINAELERAYGHIGQLRAAIEDIRLRAQFVWDSLDNQFGSSADDMARLKDVLQICDDVLDETA